MFFLAQIFKADFKLTLIWLHVVFEQSERTNKTSKKVVLLNQKCGGYQGYSIPRLSVQNEWGGG